MEIIGLHPDFNAGRHLGIVPTFLDEDDPRPAREQFDAKYIAGWNPQSGFKTRPHARGVDLLYPGDPPLECMAMINFRDETILVYDYGYFAVFQSDGSFEAARMD